MSDDHAKDSPTSKLRDTQLATEGNINYLFILTTGHRDVGV